MSRDSGGPGWIYLPESYSEFLRWVREFMTFRRKVKPKRLPKASSSVPQMCLPYYLWHVLEISTPLGSHVPFQYKFPRGITPRFSDCVDVSLPRLYTLFQTITFGLGIPDETTKIMQARAHIKPMTKAKPFLDSILSRCTTKTLLEGFG